MNTMLHGEFARTEAATRARQALLERYPRRWNAIDPVLYECADRVAFVTLHRPDDGNVVTREMRDTLRRIWADIATDDDVDAAVLSGTGTTFCAGAEASIAPVLSAIRNARKPLITAVNGIARGAGLELALAGDLRLAAASATFGPLGRVAGFHNNARTRELVRAVGLGPAMHFSRTPSPVDAQWAMRRGVVECVTPRERLMIHAEERARMLTKTRRRAA